MSITPEDRDEAREILKGASRIAQKHGLEIGSEARSPREALVAIAIMYSSFGVAAGASMHQLMGLLMETYRKTIELEDEDE